MISFLANPTIAFIHICLLWLSYYQSYLVYLVYQCSCGSFCCVNRLNNFIYAYTSDLFLSVTQIPILQCAEFDFSEKVCYANSFRVCVMNICNFYLKYSLMW